MSITWLRGLELLHILDRYGPIGLSDLARRLDTDKSSVLRMVNQGLTEGWLVREDGKVALGPRSALLGQASAANRSVRAAEMVVVAVAAATGLLTQAVGLVGRTTIGIATADRSGLAQPIGQGLRIPLWAGAGAKVVASQLPADDLDAILPEDPLPDPREVLCGYRFGAEVMERFEPSGLAPARPDAPTTQAPDRRALRAQLDRIRAEGVFRERGELHANSSCIAVPWPQDGFVAALACIATTAEIDASAVAIEAVLRAAARPRATAEDVAEAAERAGTALWSAGT